MNPSGSEFTLRVAICDLVERLKRMQHKCSYLEECRNQLVKEVIRLRLQNEWLAKQISDSPSGISSSLPQNLQCFCNHPSLVNSPYHHTPHCHLSGTEAAIANEMTNSEREVDLLCLNHKTNDSNKEESLHLMNILNHFEQEDLGNKQDSIKNLTIQMLKDLETEMKTGRLKSDLIKFVKNHSSFESTAEPFKTELMKFDENNALIENQVSDQTKLSSNSSANYEAFNNNSDYYSNSHNLNIPLDDLFTQNGNKESDLKSNKSCSKSVINFNLKEENNKLEILHKQQQTTMNGTKDSTGVDDDLNLTFTDEMNANSSLIRTGINLKDNELINIVISVRNDMKNLQQNILDSTDKLNKIKSRQLRYFFQKQINLEHTSANKNKLTTLSQGNNHQFGNNNGLK